MTYEENDTMRFIGKQSIGIVPSEAKTQIYDIADVYMKNSEMGFSGMLRYGTDVFILGYLYGRGEVKNGISK